MCPDRFVRSIRLVRLGYAGLPSSAAFLVGLPPPWRRTSFPQRNLRGVHTGPGSRFLRRSFGVAHLSAPCHQYPDELISTILGNRWIGGTPFAPVDDEVVPVVGDRRKVARSEFFSHLGDRTGFRSATEVTDRDIQAFRLFGQFVIRQVGFPGLRNDLVT